MGVNQVKIAGVVVLLALAAINAHAASTPRYSIKDHRVCYAWLNRQDAYSTLLLPTVLGPAVKSALPTNTFISSEDLFIGDLITGPGYVTLRPRIRLVSRIHVDSISDRAAVSGYGLKSNHLRVIIPGNFFTASIGKNLVVMVGNNLFIAKGSGLRVIESFGVAYVSLKKAMLISVSPERSLGAVYTWKPKLSLPSQLPF